MRQLLVLVPLQLRSMLAAYSGGSKNKKRSLGGFGALLLLGGIALYLSGIYSSLFASQLAPVGQLDLLFLLMSFFPVFMGLMFTLFAAQGVVFGGRDNDLMLALPITPFTLLLSRTLALYLENLIFALLVFLPAGTAYVFFGGGNAVALFLRLIPVSLLLAFLPTLFSLVLGFVLSYISSKLTHGRGLLSILLYLIFFAGIFVLSFSLNGSMGNFTQLAQQLGGWAAPFRMTMEFVVSGSLTALLGLSVICLVPFLLVVWFASTRYQTILTALQSHSTRSDYRLGSLAASSQRKALLVKEARRLFSSPIYLFNAAIGLIFLLAAGIAALVFGGQLRALLAQWAAVGLPLPLLPLSALCLCFLLSMVNITGSGISLEGRYFWILQEAPLEAKTVLRSKITFQLLATLSCTLVATVGVSLALRFSPLDALILFLAGGLFAWFTAQFGLYINLLFPRLDAPNDMIVVKQSMAAFISLFGAMLWAALLGLFFFFLSNVLPEGGALLACLVLELLAALILHLLLTRRGVSMYETIVG